MFAPCPAMVGLPPKGGLILIIKDIILNVRVLTPLQGGRGAIIKLY